MSEHTPGRAQGDQPRKLNECENNIGQIFSGIKGVDQKLKEAE